MRREKNWGDKRREGYEMRREKRWGEKRREQYEMRKRDEKIR